MVVPVQKMLTLINGKRMPIKLDESTWQAIEWLATQNRQTWQEWCSDIVGINAANENVTASIRQAAMSSLLEKTIFPDRGNQIAQIENHALIRNSASLSDDQLDQILKKASITGQSDYGGFAVLFGFDEHGQDCVWIQNGLRDGLHFAFTAA